MFEYVKYLVLQICKVLLLQTKSVYIYVYINSLLIAE
jgi:hypothetical protein